MGSSHPGSFANLYEELQRVNCRDSSLADRLTDFEKAFDRFARTQDSTDLRSCIHMASNYVEGLASVTSGIPAKGNTLGALVKGLVDWPHDKIRESLVNLYHFCSDYPGIRHPGTPANARRPLAIRDATMACLLLQISAWRDCAWPLNFPRAILKSLATNPSTASFTSRRGGGRKGPGD